MPLITQSEYVEIDGTPLATPAWEVTNLAELWDIASILGDTPTVPYRRGVVPFRRALGGKNVDLPITVFGTEDPDGNPYASARAGLEANRDLLIRDVIRPPRVDTADGTRLLRYHLPSGAIRSGPMLIAGGLRPKPKGPGALEGSITVVLTEGGLRSETEVDVSSSSVPDAGLEDVAVPNPGLDYQDALLIDLTGSATYVKLTNLTADPGGDIWLEFAGDISLGTGVAIDTKEFTAVRDGVNAVGLIDYSGFERWLPLVPGTDNTIRVEPTGGTVTARFRHFPFYL
jgi:hypothetical protein